MRPNFKLPQTHPALTLIHTHTISADHFQRTSVSSDTPKWKKNVVVLFGEDAYTYFYVKLQSH